MNHGQTLHVGQTAADMRARVFVDVVAFVQALGGWHVRNLDFIGSCERLGVLVRKPVGCGAERRLFLVVVFGKQIC